MVCIRIPTANKWNRQRAFIHIGIGCKAMCGEPSGTWGWPHDAKWWAEREVVGTWKEKALYSVGLLGHNSDWWLWDIASSKGACREGDRRVNTLTSPFPIPPNYGQSSQLISLNWKLQDKVGWWYRVEKGKDWIFRVRASLTFCDYLIYTSVYILKKCLSYLIQLMSYMFRAL